MSQPITIRRWIPMAAVVALVVASAMTSAGAAPNRPARPVVGEPVVLFSVAAPRPNSSVADQLELNYPEVHYIKLDLDDLVDHLVTSLQLPQIGANSSCRALVPRDNVVAVAGTTISFERVEASMCDPGSGYYLEWHGRCRNEDGDIVASIAVSVLFDESGNATGATGGIELGSTSYELWPVEGDTYALYRDNHDAEGQASGLCPVSAPKPPPLRVTPHVDPDAAAVPAAPVHTQAVLTG